MSKKDSKALKKFVALCKHLDRDQIYEVFESGALKEKIRTEVYGYSTAEDNEPCRAAMIRLGEKYDVQSLINF